MNETKHTETKNTDGKLTSVEGCLDRNDPRVSALETTLDRLGAASSQFGLQFYETAVVYMGCGVEQLVRYHATRESMIEQATVLIDDAIARHAKQHHGGAKAAAPAASTPAPVKSTAPAHEPQHLPDTQAMGSAEIVLNATLLDVNKRLGVGAVDLSNLLIAVAAVQLRGYGWTDDEVRAQLDLHLKHQPAQHPPLDLSAFKDLLS